MLNDLWISRNECVVWVLELVAFK